MQKSLASKLSDAREAVVNKIVDICAQYKAVRNPFSKIFFHRTSPSDFWQKNNVFFKVHTGGPATQIVLPDNLRALPLYALAIIKSIIFRQSPQGTKIYFYFWTTPLTLNLVPADVRTYQYSAFRIIPTDLGSIFLYPQLFALHQLAPEVQILHTAPFLSLILFLPLLLLFFFVKKLFFTFIPVPPPFPLLLLTLLFSKDFLKKTDQFPFLQCSTYLPRN